MLVKFFQYGAVKKGQKGHSGGGGAVKNYLLGKDYDKGVIRDGATLFRGDPNETTSIINGIERQSYYKSLVLSFTESDSKKLDDNKLNEIIDDFNATMFPTFNESQYSGYWVKHMDKGRIELHGVYAEEELTSGYGLNVYVATVDKPLVDSWKDLINDKYDLDDPNAPMHKRARAITKGFELKKGYEPKKTKIADEELKNQIEKELLEYVNNHPEITNRDGIISAFEELDYKVERQGKNYISIEHPEKKNNPDLKNLRFKSDIYSQDFNRSMLSKNKSYEQREYERKRPERIAKAKNIYDSSLQKRIERMTHRYRNIERKPLDNQLTHDLRQIRANSEPNFLKQVAEYQRQELKKIIGQSIEQIYKQHEHDQPERLVSLKELHQILIDDIDNQLKDEPLPQFDEIIANYQNSKNHIVTVDHIEHDRRQAELLARQQAEQEFKANIQSQLDYMLSNGSEVLPHDAYIKWQSLSDSDLADYLTDYQRQGQALLDKAHNQILDPQELQNDKLIKDVITTINDITANRERDHLEQLRAEQAKIKFDNQIKAQLDALASITGQVTKSLYDSLRTYEPSELDQIKVTHTNLTERLLDTAGRELISDFDNDLDKFTTSKNIGATIERIIVERKQAQEQARIAEQKRLADMVKKPPTVTPKPQDKPSAPTTLSEQNKPLVERVSVADDRNAKLAQAQKIIADFDKLVKGNAEKLKTATVKDRTEKFNKASKALTDLGKKPLFMGKEQWEVDNKKLTLKKRNAEISLDQAKGDTEKLKQWNFKLELFREKELQPINYTAIALERLDKTTKDKVQQAHDVIDQINDEINREKAQSLGAERLAKTGEYYTGKVIKVNQHGAYQQTKQGVVLHPAYANQPNEFKAEQSYDLNYRTQGKVLKSETYEIRISGNSKDVAIDSNKER